MCTLLTCVCAPYACAGAESQGPVETAHSSGLKLLEELGKLHQCIIYIALSRCMLPNKLLAWTRRDGRSPPTHHMWTLSESPSHNSNFSLQPLPPCGLQWDSSVNTPFISFWGLERAGCQSIGDVMCSSKLALNKVMSYRGARQESWLVI